MKRLLILVYFGVVFSQIVVDSCWTHTSAKTFQESHLCSCKNNKGAYYDIEYCTEGSCSEGIASSSALPCFPLGFEEHSSTLSKVIKTIRIAKSELYDIGTWFCDYNILEEIEFFNAKITSLPNCLDKLSNLLTFSLTFNNELSSLPDTFGKNWGKITKLSFDSGTFKTLPSGMSGLTGLTTLIMPGLHIETVFSGIAALTELKEVDLSRNDIKTIPMLGPIKLDNLLLQNNRLSSLTFLNNVLTIQNLNLQSNSFTVFPKITSVKLLSTLDLSSNQIGNNCGQQPDCWENEESFNTLNGLKTMLLHKNNIKSITEKFNQLTSLEHLDLSSNQLETLPSLSLPELTCFKANANNFKTFSSSLTFPELKTLELGFELGSNKALFDPNFSIGTSKLDDFSLSGNIESLPKSIYTLEVTNYYPYGQIEEITVDADVSELGPVVTNSLTRKITLKNTKLLSFTSFENEASLVHVQSLALIDNFEMSDCPDLSAFKNCEFIKFSNNKFKFDSVKLSKLPPYASLSMYSMTGKIDLGTSENGLNLKDLDLSHSTNIDGSLNVLTALTALTLVNASVTDSFAASLQTMENLSYMKVNGADLSNGLLRLENLKTLVIEGDSLDMSYQVTNIVPRFFSSLTSLTALNYSGNLMENLNFDTLRNMKDLDLSNNYLSSFSNVFTSMSNISNLNVSKNRLLSIPSLSSLRYMETLDVSENIHLNYLSLALITISSQPTSATKDLNVSNTSLEKILGPIKQLTALDISNTLIKDFAFLSEMTSLIRLKVGGLNIDSLDLIANKANIVALDISGTKITNLSGFTALTELNISNTSANLDGLNSSRLVSFSAKGYSLPTGFNISPNAVSVDVRETSILPEFYASLSQLTSLKITGNLSKNLPNLKTFVGSSANSGMLPLTITHLEIDNYDQVDTLKYLTSLSISSAPSNFDFPSLRSFGCNTIDQIASLSSLYKKLTDLSIHGNLLVDQSMTLLTNFELLSFVDFSSLNVADLPPFTLMSNLRIIKMASATFDTETNINSCLKLPLDLLESSLASLTISQLDTIPNFFSNMSQLTQLKLVGVSSIPSYLSSLTNLQIFDMEECPSVSSIPGFLFTIPSLTFIKSDIESLSLSLLPLSIVPDSLKSLTQLTSLALTSSEFTDVSGLSSLNKLNSLVLDKNLLLTSIPSFVTTLSLSTFSAEGINPLTFPEEFWVSQPALLDFTVSITELTLSGYNDPGFPPAFLSQATSLKTLDLSSSVLTNHMEVLVHLSKLENLNLKDTGISTLIPSSGGLLIDNMSHLVSIDVSSNDNLDTLPKQLFNIPTLLTVITDVTSLDLSNELIAFPPSLLTLTTLTNLDLSGNSLSYFPDEFFKISSIEILNLSSNALVKIPETIKEMENLKELNLSHNKLNEISPEITSITSLVSIDLTDNYLTSLPEFDSSVTVTYNDNCFLDSNTDSVKSKGCDFKPNDSAAAFNDESTAKTTKTISIVLLAVSGFLCCLFGFCLASNSNSAQEKVLQQQYERARQKTLSQTQNTFERREDEEIEIV